MIYTKSCLIKKLTFVLFISILSAGNCFADDWKSQIIDQLNTGSINVQDPSGNTVLSHNENKLMVPASILKIATADAILSNLGENFHIQTDFYLTEDNYLGIKGFGDPTLVSESLSLIAKQLKKQLELQSNTMLKGFWLDTSYFKSRLNIHGQSNSNNPYDSSVGALVANYNTIHIYKSKSGKISSAEPQTPLTPTAVLLAKKLSPGKHRVNIGKNNKLALRYFSELLQFFLKKEGIDIPVNIVNKAIPVNSKKLIVHHSQPVSEIIRSLFSYSNNLIANQLLIILGGIKMGEPADLDKGKQILTEFLLNIIGINNFTMEEGSGLSRRNQFSANQIMSVLLHFKPYQYLLRVDNDHFQAKTGTLKGVSTYAGYMISPDGGSYPFVIMLNETRRWNERNKLANIMYKGLFK